MRILFPQTVNHDKQNMKRISMLMSLLLLAPAAGYSEDIRIAIDSIGKDIEFTVCNTSQEKSLEYIGVSVQRKEKESWTGIRWNVDCPCGAKCRRTVMQLAAGECRQHRWDKKAPRCYDVEHGTYRFAVHGIWNSETKHNEIVGYSDQFNIQK